MAAAYTVEPLSPEGVDQAYPLIQAIEPELDRARWHRLYESLCAEAGPCPAVLVVTAATRRFYALCCADVLREADGRSVLSISRLMIDSAFDARGIGEVLLRALADYAARNRCARVRIAVAGTDAAAMRALSEAQAALGTGLAIQLA